MLTISVEAFSNGNLVVSIDKRIQAIESKFGISITYKENLPIKGDVQYKLISQSKYPLLYKYLGLFEREIKKYPINFFKKKNIRKLMLVEYLFKGETAIEGFYRTRFNIVVIDIFRSAKSESLQRHSIHHEIFHMMAFQEPISSVLDKENWKALNISNFNYGKQTKPLTELNPLNTFAPNELGFVTYYAMQSVDEDQAEVFACLMQKKNRRLIEKWQEKDFIIRKKIEIIKQFVAKYDFDMNEVYWQRLVE